MLLQMIQQLDLKIFRTNKIEKFIENDEKLKPISEDEKSIEAESLLWEYKFNNQKNSQKIGFSSLGTYDSTIKDFNEYLRTFSVGAYFYSETAYVSGFEIGYQYTDQTSNQVITHLKNFDTVINSNWVFISETFDAPPDDTAIRLKNF